MKSDLHKQIETVLGIELNDTDTGGHCSALMSNEDNNAYIMITNEDGTDIPTSFNDCFVGFYVDSMSINNCKKVSSIQELVDFVRQMENTNKLKIS